MGVVIAQYEVYLINLDPTVGHEMNESIQTIIVAPMTTKSHPFPTRVPIV